ncbi:rhomboid family intramembrane serine protease [Akkermansiaceae bacterium]|nr:rhomboid family intramembrane serine protease [Akkermansiaceae bacterium]
MVVIHLVIVNTGGISPNGPEGGIRPLYLQAGLSWEGVASGQVWQIFTYFWLHGGWSHLILNVILFYYSCARLSHVLSGLRILVLFLAVSIGAGLIHIFAQAVFLGLPRVPLVGASGGVMGLLLAYFALSPGSRMLLIPVSANNLAKGILIASALLFVATPSLGIPLLRDLGQGLEELVPRLFQVAHLLHFAGGLIGWVAIPGFFPKLLTLEDLVRMRNQSEISTGAG